MKKIKIVHIDDEPKALENFRLQAKEYLPNVVIVGQASNAIQGVKIIKETAPDLILLDISMPGGSGFDMLDAIGSFNFQIIFLTAFEDHAISAIKRNALDYLLKPLDLDELERALKKVELSTKEIDKIFVNTMESIEIIQVSEILFLQAENNYTHFILNDRARVLASKGLAHFQNLLPSTNFIKTHQSYVVNISMVKRLIKEDNGYLEMINQDRIPISRSNKKQIYSLFQA